MYSIGVLRLAEKLTCAKCAAPIERQSGAGRPAIYCGPACRASAAYEIRRIQRRLEALETFIGVLGRPEVNTWAGAWAIKRREKEREKKVEAVKGEIAEAEERLRLLLSERRGKTLEPKP